MTEPFHRFDPPERERVRLLLEARQADQIVATM
jgi:hypothetical protein